MNKYLVKIADELAQPEKQKKQSGPFNVAAQESAASLVPDFAGAAAGNIVGNKVGIGAVKFLGHEHNLGGMAGAALGGLAANYGVLKYHQLKGQQK
jgi:hypothetical protein